MVGLIPYNELAELKLASDVKDISAGAKIAHQVSEVAYVINTAANTGEYRAYYNGELLPETIELLESNGYTIVANARSIHSQSVISWI